MSSTLISCPSIGGHQIWRDDSSRALIVDNMLLRFTQTEYRVLLPLLTGKVGVDNDLTQAAFNADATPQNLANLERHVGNIRHKLRPSGLYVQRLTSYGYLLRAITES